MRNTEWMNWSIKKQKFLHRPKMLVLRNYGNSENLGGKNGNHEKESNWNISWRQNQQVLLMEWISEL